MLVRRRLSCFRGPSRLRAPAEDLTKPISPAGARPDLCRRRNREGLRRRGKRFFPVGKEIVHALTNFSLDETATAGGGLEFGGGSLVPSAPLPEFAYCIHADIGVGQGLAKVSQGAFEPIEKRVLG